MRIASQSSLVTFVRDLPCTRSPYVQNNNNNWSRDPYGCNNGVIRHDVFIYYVRTHIVYYNNTFRRSMPFGNAALRRVRHGPGAMMRLACVDTHDDTLARIMKKQ